ncbi:endonuclease MutS2 [Acholeplasma granularum]|uniref:endonuclease MutS2 n=1 Tax=Acholeplasma granularum TaxID=264635 RepID=UPI000470E590|nr:endonuclease MutS2 [Acholeplasma granularum]
MFSHKTLELDKILLLISEYTFSDSAKTMILETMPNNKEHLVLENLNQTNELKTFILNYGKLPFINDFDILKIVHQIKSFNYLKIDDLIKIKKYILMEKTFESYKSTITNHPITYNLWLKDLKHHKEVLNIINSKISDDDLIYDDATLELKNIRQNLKSKTKLLDRLLESVLDRYQNYLNERIIVTRSGRYAIPIKETYKNKVKGIIHDISASKQTVYIEPEEIRQTTQDIEYLKRLEENEEIKILTQILTEIKPHQLELLLHIENMVHLDNLHAKALYAIDIRGILPIINPIGKIYLLQARHPLIDPKIVVPIDVSLSKEQNVLMITGPNTGGKTVALKTVGLLTLMLQSGILVPASENSQMSIFNQVFADIGDEQSIQQSLSTFSSHLTKIKTMFDKLKSKALILLDELGSGTDPVEGVSLAISIIDNLRQKKDIRMILTTHYSELKLYAYEHEDILTASVAFDEKSLKPLYQLRLGVAGSSHALSIASRLGIPKDIIDHAQKLLNGRQSNLAKSLEKLSKEQNELDELKLEFQNKVNELNTEIELYQSKIKNFEVNRDIMLEKIRQKELKKHEKLKEELVQMIDELSKKSQITTPEVASIKGKLNKGVTPSKFETDEVIKVGDYVVIENYGQEGIVTEIRKDKYYVSAGLFELPFNKSDLKKTQKKIKKEEPKKVKYTGSNPSKAPAFELDLRGKRYEEVAVLMDKAIDDALLSNTSYIRVIHGFGTGAVRKAVYAYIKTSPYIKSHRYGTEGEGLNGVTVITL